MRRAGLPVRTHMIPSSLTKSRNLLIVFCFLVYAVGCVCLFFWHPGFSSSGDDGTNKVWGLELIFRKNPRPITPRPQLPILAKETVPTTVTPVTPSASEKAVEEEPTEIVDSVMEPSILYLVRQVESPTLCLTESAERNGFNCFVVKFEECSKTSRQDQWRLDSTRNLRNLNDNCLDLYRDGSDMHACSCHRETNQQWFDSQGQIKNVLLETKCVGMLETEKRLAKAADCSEPYTTFEFERVPDILGSQEDRLRTLSSKILPNIPYKGIYSDNDWADHEAMDYVRRMMEFGFLGYELYAWGYDELRPGSRSGRNWLGHTGLAATIVDSLDTLLLMGLTKQYEHAAEYVEQRLTFDMDVQVSFFETVIRDLGGLLSAYAMTGKQFYVDKAEDLGRRLLPGFNSQFGLPYGQINLKTGSTRNHNWMPNNHILAEIGTVQLEFKYLSYVTGNPVYGDKVEAVMEYLRSLPLRDKGLYPVFYQQHGPPSMSQDYTLGGLGDSFYEYELKQWLFTNKTEQALLQMYDESAKSIMDMLVGRINTRQGSIVYVGKYKNGFLEPKMEHLACFTGGMLALGAWTRPNVNPAKEMEIAAALTQTCRESYAQTATKLGPEKFGFTNEGALIADSIYYILRPEYVESLFYMWRFTHDRKYREWGWDVVMALVTHCKSNAGFSGIQNVNNVPAQHNDQQESFFFAETLKYLFLLYSNDDAFPLDRWVFNTEAHPLPVIPFWRKAK